MHVGRAAGHLVSYGLDRFAGGFCVCVLGALAQPSCRRILLRCVAPQDSMLAQAGCSVGGSQCVRYR